MSAGRPRGQPKTGGRVKGVPNKSTRTIEELCEARGCSPIEILIDFAQGPDDAYRFNATKELCQYLYPKRRALEVDATVNMELAKKAEEYASLPEEEQIRLMEEELKRLKGES